MKKKQTALLDIPFFRFLASVTLTVVCLFLLFILTFWGTIDQAQHGLYEAQQKFFYSLVFLNYGWIPFPGAKLVLGVLFFNLLAAAVFRLQYTWEKSGILIVHGGLLLFFVAAFVTYRWTEESHVSLVENEATNVSQDYHRWELSLWQEKGDTKSVRAFDLDRIQEKKIWTPAAPELKIEVVKFYPNAQAFAASGPQRMELKPLAREKEPEKNIPGGVFVLTPSGGLKKTLFLFGGEENPQRVTVAGQEYLVQLRRKRYVLPFLIQLKDFRKEVYPGTQLARSFESTVEIKAHQMTRETIISMNNPLRYEDYTFYQASYGTDHLGREMSTLAVVKNRGRMLPYLASLVVVWGLVWHFMVAFYKAVGLKRRGGL